jgi:type IV secretory pathway VirB3-like protein
MTPFFVVFAVFVLAGVWFSPFIVLGFPPVFLTMREVTKSDDQAFRLLGLKIYFRVARWQNGSLKFWGAASYSPVDFKKRR